MKVSLNYLRHYLDFELPEINELVNVIGSRLGAMDELPLNLNEVYRDVLIVRVEECSPIEGTDHLNLCLINDGLKVKGVKRNDKGYVSVVCGAPNVKAGILAAWLPPGSIVPSSYFKEPLKLETKEIRGQLSNGMLASAKELDITDDHEGLLIVDENVGPGDSFAKVYELDDYLIDIENKMFTHRPDCFGIIGVAREVSGILNHLFKSPEWYLKPTNINVEGDIKLSIKNEIPSKVPRFSLIVIDNIKVEPSPIAVQSYLFRMGIRPINNIVDLTNLVMLETGQPLHAYDYNKLKNLSGGELAVSVRPPRANEVLTLLSDKQVKPGPETICIAVNDQLIGLGGVMGGKNSEVDSSTTSIVLEAACFDMYDIRRTSMELGVFSEAVTRFTKGQSPLQTKRILTYAVNKLKEMSKDCKIASDIVDDIHISEAMLNRDSIHPPISIKIGFINDRLGLALSSEQIAGYLRNVECTVNIEGDSLMVAAPFWRTDIEIREDVVEEVGRLYGFENITPSPLSRPLLAIPKNRSLGSKAELRRLLAAAGANELLNYSFVSKKIIEGSNQDINKAYEVVNSLSPDLNYYRLSLTPSLLSKVNPNIKAGFDKFAIFEIGTYHLVGSFDKDEPDLPAEYQSLALVYTSRAPESHAAYFRAKQFLSYLLDELNISNVYYVPLDKAGDLTDYLIELAKPFDKSRSALIKSDDVQLGIVGEFGQSVLSNLKLPSYSAGFELDSRLFLNDQRDKVYKRLSKYPELKQDITLSINNKSNFADINSFLLNELSKLVSPTSVYKFTPSSIFKPENSNDNLNYTFHLEIADEDKTLKDQEVNEILDKLAGRAHDQFGANRV